jgi:hypothetical protein
MIVVGYHRSAALAHKHLLALRREHRDATVELIGRRTAKGRYSSRGRYFWYEITKHESKIELVLHFDYGSSRARDLLRFQVHVIGPGNAADDEALRIVRSHFSEGKRFPVGWRQKTIFWGHSRPGDESDVERDYSKGDDSRIDRLAEIAIGGGEGKVSRRTTVKTRRRAGKKRAKK